MRQSFSHYVRVLPARQLALIYYCTVCVCLCGVYFRWSVSHALYRLACKLLALFVLASPLPEQGPSNRVAYGTPSGVITGPSLGRVVPS
jgi:hypothetical protein